MSETRKPAATRRFGWALLATALLVGAVGAGWWAARATLGPAAPPTTSGASPVTTEVVTGTVGRTVGVGVTLEQPVDVVATNTLTGMVTAVRERDNVDVGDVVYEVAGIPIRVVSGTTPFYRDLSLGVRGADVTQLQNALRTLGHLDHPADGRFGVTTRDAVRAWQRALRLPETGTVPLGEVLSVPTLPSEMVLGSEIRRGALVGGGEPAVLVAGGSQRFTLVLSSDQATTITSEVPLKVYFEDLVWEARAAGGQLDDNGHTVRELVAPDGGPVCMDQCDRLPPDERLSLRADAVVTPEITGPVVPAAAVRTGADAQPYVLMADGSRRDVVVLGSSQGLAAVDGVRAGEEIVVLEAANPAADATPPAPQRESSAG